MYLARFEGPLSLLAFDGTPHQVFLVILILASKYVNDQSPSNKKWAQYCKAAGVVLGISDITGLEIRTLDLLGWSLGITSEDLYLVLEPLLRPIRQGMAARKPLPQHRE